MKVIERHFSMVSRRVASQLCGIWNARLPGGKLKSKRDADVLLGRRSGPDRKPSTPSIGQHLGTEVLFVFPFDLRHSQQAVDKFFSGATQGITRGIFILDDVSSLQFSSSIHRCKPPADMTQCLQCTTDHACPDLPLPAGSRAQLLKHLTDKPPVMPLLFFNGPDAPPLLGIRNRMPMA